MGYRCRSNDTNSVDSRNNINVTVDLDLDTDKNKSMIIISKITKE